MIYRTLHPISHGPGGARQSALGSKVRLGTTGPRRAFRNTPHEWSTPTTGVKNTSEIPIVHLSSRRRLESALNGSRKSLQVQHTVDGRNKSSLFSLITRELEVYFRCTKWGAFVVGIPLVLIGLYGVMVSGQDISVQVTTRLLVLAVLISYFTDMMAQVKPLSIEEDRLNKPMRPLPSGMITIEGGWARVFITGGLLMGFGYLQGALQLVVATMVVYVCYEWFGGNQHWLVKNPVYIPLGSYLQFATAVAVAAPSALPICHPILLCISLAGALVYQIQDLGDVDGDRAGGRKTMPIVLGDRITRMSVLAGMCPVAAGYPLALSHWVPGISEYVILPFSLIHVAGAAAISYRLVNFQGGEADQRTYVGFTGLCCFWVATPLVATLFSRLLVA